MDFINDFTIGFSSFDSCYGKTHCPGAYLNNILQKLFHRILTLSPLFLDILNFHEVYLRDFINFFHSTWIYESGIRTKTDDHV